MAAVGEVEPAGHAYPAVHVPLHVMTPIPGVDPKRPATQAVHVTAPVREY